MARADPADRFAATSAPYPWRRHQAEALEALTVARGRGRSRAWVALPPGAGKTLVGLETLRREGRPAVVLCPNTAVQRQWVDGWRTMRTDVGVDPVEVSTDRDLRAPVSVLTYQSLAVFAGDDGDDGDDGDEDVPDGELGRLHPHGRELVERLVALGPLTLVLDECHHLLETWGRLLSEVLALLPDAVVLGLTATPPATLRGAQARLVDDLFGEIVYAASVPAVVREGHLAPFVDLIWMVTPTAPEEEWLDDARTRFTELTTALTDPEHGSTPFLVWLDRRFAGELGFDRVATAEPELADAALRMRGAELLRLPDAEHVPPAERHRRPPDADDWALLLDDWYTACLSGSDDPSDVALVEAMRRALPSVGWQLTRHGLRRGRSGVDRVLARSAAKARALVEIVSAEHRALGDRLAMLVVCDHERATATLPTDLTGVVDARAGSARGALADLLSDPVTAGLSPVMVTGRTVAAAPATLVRLAARLPELDLVVGEADADGVAELTGRWRSRDWVGAVTEFLDDGECRVLLGTRALLGEGWDAPRLSGLVDLGTSTTTASVVQTRGRSLRLDPDDPSKVAVNWTVCAVAPAHPGGDSDWGRVVRKHDGYFGVDGSGEVVDGVAHVHPGFSPFAPPDPATYDATNAEMVVRAETRGAIADAWRVGEPYDDEVRVAAWFRRPEASGPAAEPLAERRAGSGRGVPPREAVLGEQGLVVAEPSTWPRSTPWPVPVALLTVTVLLAVLVPAAAVVVLAVCGGALAAREVRVAARRAVFLRRALLPADLLDVAAATADALVAVGLVTSRPGASGAEAVTWRIDGDGTLRVDLDGSGVAGSEESELFARALAEVAGPVARPRYVVERHHRAPPAGRWEAWRLRTPGAVRPHTRTVHAVPEVLGLRRESADAFAEAWRTRVGGGAATWTGGPEGAGLLVAARGADPMAPTAALRTTWR